MHKNKGERINDFVENEYYGDQRSSIASIHSSTADHHIQLLYTHKYHNIICYYNYLPNG